MGMKRLLESMDIRRLFDLLPGIVVGNAAGALPGAITGKEVPHDFGLPLFGEALFKVRGGTNACGSYCGSR
jgi:hypothetical protein